MEDSSKKDSILSNILSYMLIFEIIAACFLLISLVWVNDKSTIDKLLFSDFILFVFTIIFGGICCDE